MHPTLSSPPAVIALPVRSTVEARPLWRCHAPATEAGVSRKTAQRLCDAAMLATSAAFALPVRELASSTRRSPYAAFARQSAMYLAHVAFGLSYTEIGRGFRRDRTTAAYACRLVEDWRDDPAIDMVLTSLEGACSRLRHRLVAKVLP